MLTQLHDDWRSVITRRRYPTANVARQAMLTYSVGVAHPSHRQQAAIAVRDANENYKHKKTIIVSQKYVKT